MEIVHKTYEGTNHSGRVIIQCPGVKQVSSRLVINKWFDSIHVFVLCPVCEFERKHMLITCLNKIKSQGSQNVSESKV